ncbi:MAG: Uma2 family endonuclease [Isosphaeraceae bacterium]
MSAPLSIPAAESRGGRPYRISAESYRRMLAAGAIPGADRVELWEGQLVEKMGKNPPHVIALSKLTAALIRALPEGWHVAPECPLELGPLHVPEPDLTVVRGAPDDYPDGPPTAADVGLVVEVADTSLREDLGRVRDAYAAAGVPVYWVVNLRGRRIETHAEPTGGDDSSYGLTRSHGPDETIPLVLDGHPIAELAVASLLPAAREA